jgi:hypothetical protein
MEDWTSGMAVMTMSSKKRSVWGGIVTVKSISAGSHGAIVRGAGGITVQPRAEETSNLKVAVWFPKLATV